MQNIDINSDKLNKYEMLILNFLFHNKMEITKNELEEKLSNTFSSYNIQVNEIEGLINKQLIEENVIDKVKQSKLTKEAKTYIKASIVLILLVSILIGFRILENSPLYMLIYFLEKVISSVMLLKANIYTNKGQILKYNIDSYKIKLKNQEFLTNKNTMEDIVLKKDFANSIALHINTGAKNAFIDNKITKEAIKISMKTIINILIIFAILILVGLIIAIITNLLPKGAIFWVYLIFAISVACVADVTLYKKK